MSQDNFEDQILENLDKPLQQIMDENPHVGFDEDLVRKGCAERFFNCMFERMSALVNPLTTIEELLQLFPQESSRQEFMAFYVVRWKERQALEMVSPEKK